MMRIQHIKTDEYTEAYNAYEKNSMHIQRQQNLPQKARLITRKQKDGQISLKDMPMKQMITKKLQKNHTNLPMITKL